MSIKIDQPQDDELRPRIAVIGVGGAGGNAVANMIAAGVEGVEFIVANTDAQALKNMGDAERIQLGPKVTEGLGAGSRPEVGRAAAEETLAEVEAALDGAHMCFIAAGMGGGTGTGAAPVIAQAARNKNILTVGVVTKPFSFEGARRMRSAEAGIAELQEAVDTLIVIPNQNLFLVANANTTFKEAFQLADEVLQQGVRSITDLMVMPGLINLDFADVRSVMSEMGKAMMGTGEAEGDNRALEAAEKAIANPLLDGVSMQGAKGVIVSITGGDDMRLLEVDEAANHIRELVDEDANIIWGSAFNGDLNGKIRVSVVATGIGANEQSSPAPSRSFSLRQSAPPVAEPAPEPRFDADPAPEAGSDSTSDAELASPLASKGTASGASLSDIGAEGESHGSDHAEPADLGLPTAHDAEPGADTLDLNGEHANLVEGDEGELILGAEPEDDPETDDGDGDDDPAPRFGRASRPDMPPAPRVTSGGGTLFERMSNLNSGGKRAQIEDDEDEDDDGAVSIPRFLGKQNNQ